MESISDAVTARGQAVASAARSALAWLNENQKLAEVDAVNRLSRRARRLCAAAERPTCIAVFGASQAGKSYLVSSLATDGVNPLKVNFGAVSVDFLADLNPDGGKESTGLVSRFTTRPTNTPAGAPVALRLFSQTDIIKILANSSLEDVEIDRAPSDPQLLSEMFDRLAKSAGPAACDGLTHDDIDELREYFEHYFSADANVRDLRSIYWQRATDIIPRLPLDQRAEAFAPLWNGFPLFTNLAKKLLPPIGTLNFPDTAFCGLDALVPRGQGVLNAETLFALGTAVGAPVCVISADGSRAALDRSVLAALIAEITLPIAEKTWAFLDRIDLLDFPGFRGREQIESITAFEKRPSLLGEVFLRGKVDYLFQRYNAEQEISGLLLCVGPSVQEVQSLPRTINGWIGLTLGQTPDARARQRNSLFVILTKFDQELEEKRGDRATSGNRWTTRVKASLLDFLGKGYSWPTDWSAAGSAFNNCFWLRSREVKLSTAFDYEPGEPQGLLNREVLAPRAAGLLAPRRAAYLENDMIARHFVDPARAWDEVLRPNDGGITYLAESLAPVCDGRLKAEQIGGRIEDVARDIVAAVSHYYRSGDRAIELRRAREEAGGLVRALVQVAEAKTFGRLLRGIQVTLDDMVGLYWRLQSEPDDTPGPAVGLLDDWGELGEEITIAGSARDRFDRLAEAAVQHWATALQLGADGGSFTELYKLPSGQVRILVTALIAAAGRLRLIENLAKSMRLEGSFVQRNGSAAQRMALVMEQSINGFTYWLGFDAVAPAARPKTLKGGRTIFAPHPVIIGMPPLGSNVTTYERIFQVDWMTAISRVIEDNVYDLAENGIDIAQNDRLGAILTELRTP